MSRSINAGGCALQGFAGVVLLLFDNLVSTSEKGRWQLKAERLRRLEIDRQFVVNSLNIGQVAGIGTFEDIDGLRGQSPKRGLSIERV